VLNIWGILPIFDTFAELPLELVPVFDYGPIKISLYFNNFTFQSREILPKDPLEQFFALTTGVSAFNKKMNLEDYYLYI
jgi:hypothetical protein